jgi:hypothetical protein
MFFKESERLQQEHPSLASLIAKIDAHLSRFDKSGLANPVIFASLLNASQHQVLSVFEKLTTLDVLENVYLCECPKCKRLLPSAEYRLSVAAGDEFPCTDCGTNLVGSSPKQVMAFRLSPNALHEVSKNKMASKTKVEHLVLLIHGIRTDAVWQEKVAAELNLLPNVEAQPIGYGIFDTFRFWFPFFTRTLVLKKIENKIRLAIAMHPGAKVSVIAHSFGTYAIFRLLNEKADFRLFRVLLCGSIISDNYPWDFVQPRVEETIINECGTKDIWPAAAKSLSWGYGATGTFGFKSPGFRDRFHDIDHGGFFDDEFVKTYWVPFIEKGEVVPSPWTARRPSSPNKVTLLASLPIQWIGFGLLIWLFRHPIMNVIHSFAQRF